MPLKMKSKIFLNWSLISINSVPFENTVELCYISSKGPLMGTLSMHSGF